MSQQIPPHVFLGLPPTATRVQITTTFNTLSTQYSSSALQAMKPLARLEAQMKFRELQDAYSTLLESLEYRTLSASNSSEEEDFNDDEDGGYNYDMEIEYRDSWEADYSAEENITGGEEREEVGREIMEDLEEVNADMAERF
ncbi:hypothetical protein BU16DRAFT_565772 [Lophium mytilinum]|uniref:J domain-containing protein n=1 Tax=Lophium mytilinum TaxID=390894 RepID=A0A6A6QEL1_9PEZI|nr:hypothetical protein BU16DRAFT_565772 [Lophium mytilinum]